MNWTELFLFGGMQLQQRDIKSGSWLNLKWNLIMYAAWRDMNIYQQEREISWINVICISTRRWNLYRSLLIAVMSGIILLSRQHVFDTHVVFVAGYAAVSQLCYHITLFQTPKALLTNTGSHSEKKFFEIISL